MSAQTLASAGLATVAESRISRARDTANSVARMFLQRAFWTRDIVGPGASKKSMTNSPWCPQPQTTRLHLRALQAL